MPRGDLEPLCAAIGVHGPAGSPSIRLEDALKAAIHAGHRWLTLDSDQAFTSIVGPNGSGKSNVIDALLFIFGGRAKQLRQKSVVRVGWMGHLRDRR